MKKCLIFTVQPPGSNGEQAIRYTKLIRHLESLGWKLYFVGPSPKLSSVQTLEISGHADQYFYTKNITLSKKLSVKKHRLERKYFKYYAYSVLQLAALAFEKIVNHDSISYLKCGMLQQASKAHEIHTFDVAAGICPDFQILEVASEFAKQKNLRFISLYDDPYGAREINSFTPSAPEKQKAILDFSQSVVFASPLTMQRYIDLKLVEKSKAFCITDCYPDDIEMQWKNDTPDIHERNTHQLRGVHLGNLAEWRPIDHLLNAIELLSNQSATNSLDKHPALRIDLYGFLYNQAKVRIKRSKFLTSILGIHSTVDYISSHALARGSDFILVVIGPRHTDNLPSKFFEYLSASIPYLVIGPDGNPLQKIISELGVGFFCDINDTNSISKGIQTIISDRDLHSNAFIKRNGLVAKYSGREIAQEWAHVLEKVCTNSPP